MKKELSELEGAVLGLVRLRAPTTAHAIRSAFASSPTPYFSGSVGSIYEVVRRLERRGFVRSRARADDGRSTRDLVITALGEKTLLGWLQFEPWMAAPTPDPVRTRLLFAHAMDASAAALLLERAEASLVAELEKTPPHDEGVRAAARGAACVTRARLEWVRSEQTRDAAP